MTTILSYRKEMYISTSEFENLPRKDSIDPSGLSKAIMISMRLSPSQNNIDSMNSTRHYRLIDRLTHAIDENLFYTVAVVKEVVKGVIFYSLFDMQELRNVDFNSNTFISLHTNRPIKEATYFILSKSSGIVFKHFITISLPASRLDQKIIKAFLSVVNKDLCSKSADYFWDWGKYHYNQFHIKRLALDGNADVAFMYLEKAARLLHVEALIYLGSLYQDNIGTASLPENAKHAFNCYTIAHFLLFPKKDSRVLTNLGYCYENGIGIQKCKTTAFKYYEEAAHMNNADALFNLGICCEKGIGVKISPTLAFKYYEQAAHLGHEGAWVNLGYCYEMNFGVEQTSENSKRAFNCYQKASKLGHIIGLYNLGRFYRDSIGVPESEDNIRYAIYFYQKAFKQGDREVIEDLYELKSLMKMRKDRLKKKETPMQGNTSCEKYMLTNESAETKTKIT